MSKKRIIPLNDKAMEGIHGLKRAFREKFGRDPGPDDPLVFDLDADEPRPMPEGKMEAMMAEAAAAAGLRPELVYAIRKTGRIVTETNKHLLTQEAIDQWNAAIEEYNRLEKKPPV